MEKLICGDALEELKKLKDNSVDSIVTDPPAGIGFMGKEWDNFSDNSGIQRVNNVGNFAGKSPPRYANSDLQGFQDFICVVFVEAKRVLKPGGHALVWAIPRTSHHTAMGLERAGFEIRDCVYHIFGSGFPKSLNIGKQEGCEKWEGWGTALKPAVECWWLIRKPLSEKTVAENVLKWGVGGLNIDESRVESAESTVREIKNVNREWGGLKNPFIGGSTKGRFPSHLIHDGSEEVRECFPETNTHGGGRGSGEMADWNLKSTVIGNYKNDLGSASRFFYCAKPSKAERDEGLEEFPISRPDKRTETGMDSFEEKGVQPGRNNHPTVKAQALMTYLIKLITPPKGIVLDMFAGSGSTLIAAKKLGYPFIGIEKEEDYVKIAEARLKSVNILL